MIIYTPKSINMLYSFSRRAFAEETITLFIKTGPII